MPATILRTLPTTIVVAALSLLAFTSPTLSQLWQLDFEAVAGGQGWRLLTGHLTHFGGGHLFWDLLMFVVLAAACEGQHRRHFASSLLLMAAGISVSLGLLRSDITVYRGLSGVDTGLFVWFVADQAIGWLRRREPATAALWLVPGVAVCGKLLFEIVTGQTLFVDSSHFIPLVESHLVGAAIGLALAAWGAARPSDASKKHSPARVSGPASAAVAD
jgi:rhomboid family GlyGly-CTERM serine protease